MAFGTPFSYQQASPTETNGANQGMSATAIAAGAQAAAGVAGTVVSAMQDNEAETTMNLKPEQQVAFLQQSQQLLDSYNADLQQTYALQKAYDTRLNAIDGIIKGTIPSKDALKMFTQAANDIAMAFGSPEEAKARGYLSAEDHNMLQEMYRVNNQDYKDPTLENQLSQEKAAFEQDLARKGVTPAQRLQAMADFERIADERRFTRQEELRNGVTSRGINVLQTSAALKKQSFDMVNSRISTALQGASMLGETAQARLSGALTLQNQRANLGTAINNQYVTLGKMNYSPETNRLIGTGEVGPGSIAQQVGSPEARRYTQDQYAGVLRTANGGFTDIPGTKKGVSTYAPSKRYY